ncbi:MAG: hypothetical protein D5R99_00195 [Methanocalculus sp. MSAO_Arc1]|uniref:hypothetical protein n=1 Tax=Methanocalculus TaxID=71151 RepID=UPI000FEEEA59|nr:hypothetical protein [Methanocalculus sp. MSAO_Arc1]RQD82075.1 MAG: hypothetical protein D5R99_00195 [Methanocalculus sp. MSAO_Arc1]
MSQKIVFGMNCPSCGGRIDIQEGEQLALCPFCEAAHSLVVDKGVGKIRLKNTLDAGKAEEIVRAWFKKGLKARDLTEESRITEVSSLYLPFWRLVGQGRAIACGYTERQDTDDKGNTQTSTDYYERVVDREFTWTEIACDSGDIGVTTLRNTEGEAAPLEEGEVPTFEPTSSRDDANDRAKEGIRNMALAEATAGIENVTFSRSFILPKGFELVYYPFWIVRFRYKERGYFAIVDGVTGQILSGRAPGDPLYQTLIIGFGSAVAGSLTGFGISMLAADDGLGFLLIIVGLVMIAGAYYKFRYGSEIVEGDRPGASAGMDMSKLKGSVSIGKPQIRFGR